MGFVEQMRVIARCRVFIGVQGAALTWSAFLPRNALMVEITYDYWTARFKARTKLWRPDLMTEIVQCKVHTSDASFLSYARLAGMEENIPEDEQVTEELKQKVYEKSYQALKETYYPFKLFLSIWKMSDVICDPF